MSNARNAKLVSCFETAVEKVEKLQSSKLNKARLKFICRVICAYVLYVQVETFRLRS